MKNHNHKALCGQMIWPSAVLVQAIAAHTGLLFVPAAETVGRVCCAEVPEVRPEYRTTFTASDLIDYIYGVLPASPCSDACKHFSEIDFSHVPCPIDAAHFWALAAQGSQLRRLAPIGKPKTVAIEHLR